MAKAKKKKSKRNAAIRALKASGKKATKRNVDLYMGIAEARSGSKKKGRKKPSAKTIQAMRAGAKRYWKERTGTGTKDNHMPLKTLKHKRDRLDSLISQRTKNGWT